MKKHNTYEQDFYAWALQSAKLLRAGKLTKIDTEHVAEELESMGRSEKRELINRLAILIMHLLKWQFQSERQCNSWKFTIEEQRLEIMDLLEDSPSLHHDVATKLITAYQRAILLVVKETGLNKNLFPITCPFSLEEILNLDFWP